MWDRSILHMMAFLKRLLQSHIIKYAMVGGVGIPINVGFLFLYWNIIGLPYYVANPVTFLSSNIINFLLNQFFTYREQLIHLSPADLLKRFGKGFLTSLSATLLGLLVASGLVYFGHFTGVLAYVANPIGIVMGFCY